MVWQPCGEEEHVDALEVLTRLLVAALLTGIIGLDRELRAKPAGLRTNIVVGTATAAFTLLGAEVIAGPGVDPTRVAAQVVSGIGFLGGGAIFAAGGKPHGLTTAAALWGSAAVGLAAGSGAYMVSLALVLVLFVVLWPLDQLTQRTLSHRGRHDVQVQVVLADLSSFAVVRQAIDVEGLRIVDLQLTELREHPVVDVRLAGRAEPMIAVLDRMHDLDGVVAVAHGAVSRLED
jgi:putative Mg2+ transporter-C (MgtC) family protein